MERGWFLEEKKILKEICLTIQLSQLRNQEWIRSSVKTLNIS